MPGSIWKLDPSETSAIENAKEAKVAHIDPKYQRTARAWDDMNRANLQRSESNVNAFPGVLTRNQGKAIGV
eukprot:264381-Amphidinium_carterae.1